MSLVNDMLNDLDERRGEQARNDINIDWMTGQKNATKNRYFMPLLWLGSSLVFVVIAVGVWRNVSSENVEALEHLSRAGNAISAAKSQPLLPATENSTQKEILSFSEPEALKIETATEKWAPSSDVAAVDDEQAKVVVAGVIDPGFPKLKPTPTSPEGKRLSVATPMPEEETPQLVRTTTTLSAKQRDRSVSKNAEELIRRKKLTEAEGILVNETALNAQAIRSGVVLSSLWLSQERFLEAQALLSHLRQESPASIELVKIQARLHLMTSEARKTLDLLMTFSPSMDSHADYYELLGLSARQEQQYELSVQAYKGLLEYNSSRGDWRVGMAIALDLQGEKQAAISAYRSALGSRQLPQALRDYAQQRLSAL